MKKDRQRTLSGFGVRCFQNVLFYISVPDLSILCFRTASVVQWQSSVITKLSHIVRAFICAAVDVPRTNTSFNTIFIGKQCLQIQRNKWFNQGFKVWHRIDKTTWEYGHRVASSVSDCSDSKTQRSLMFFQWSSPEKQKKSLYRGWVFCSHQIRKPTWKSGTFSFVTRCHECVGSDRLSCQKKSFSWLLLKHSVWKETLTQTNRIHASHDTQKSSVRWEVKLIKSLKTVDRHTYSVLAQSDLTILWTWDANDALLGKAVQCYLIQHYNTWGSTTKLRACQIRKLQ